MRSWQNTYQSSKDDSWFVETLSIGEATLRGDKNLNTFSHTGKTLSESKHHVPTHIPEYLICEIGTKTTRARRQNTRDMRRDGKDRNKKFGKITTADLERK